MKAFNFVLGTLVGLAIGLNFFYYLQTTYPPPPKIETVIQTEYETEYIKVNQTEPMDMTVTAYTAGPESTGKRPGMKDYGITFTGTQAHIGVCAVDPNYIPLGTSLFVEGYGYCHSEDTGGKVKGWHVDVFVNKVADAMQFDPKNKHKVWILNDFGEELN